MTLEDLKIKIESDEISDDFMIFKYDDNTFLIDQYLEELTSRKNCGIKNISSIFETRDSALSLVFDIDLDINVLRVEEFDEFSNNYSDLKNVIVVCNKINKKIEKDVKEYVINFSKLVDWQVVDYLSIICPGLTEEDYTWLYKACEGNIYKIVNEIDKIRLFEEKERPEIFKQLKEDKSDLFTYNIFELTRAIEKRDTLVLYEYLARLNYVKFDPIAISNILLKDYKHLAYVRSDAPPEKVGLEQKQVWAIKKNMNCTNASMVDKIKFLSGIDLRLKDNRLECAPDCLLSYIVNKMLA